jgi:hypothetical protein
VRRTLSKPSCSLTPHFGLSANDGASAGESSGQVHVRRTQNRAVTTEGPCVARATLWAQMWQGSTTAHKVLVLRASA